MKQVPLRFLSALLFLSNSASASYQVKLGDTLSEIAEAKYGNYIKWHNLFDINRNQIANPDLIYPGQRLRLLTDEELEFFTANGTAPADSDADPGQGGTRIRNRGHRSQEWRVLPLQNWEKFVFRLDAAIDPDGFDRRSRVPVRFANSATAQTTIASDRIPVLGEIINARTEFERVFIGEQVFVRPDENLQVGSVYSITTGPQKITSKRDSRVGFSYDLTGKVRIVGVRDGLFIATVTALYHPIQRHQLLIPEVSNYHFVPAVPATTAVPATVLTSQADREDMLAEQKIVFFDVGTEDGVKPGMIFRHYLHTDPATNEEISTKDFLIESEFQVLSALDKFSIAVILQSHSMAHFGDEVIALTDLKDFGHNQGLQTVIQDIQKSTTVDDLDHMDTSDGLGEKENHDLRQLEKWSKPAPEPAPPASGDSSSLDDIQKIDTHEHPQAPVDIGNEAGPNDGTSKRPVTAPPSAEPPPTGEAPPNNDATGAPEMAPAPEAVPAAPDVVPSAPQKSIPAPETGTTQAPPAAPAAPPTPPVAPSTDPNAPPAPQVDSLGPSIDRAPPPTHEPPPIQKTNPLPTADPFATPSP